MDQTARPTTVAQIVSILTERYDPAGRRLLDVGCGAGDFVKQMLRKGADAVGLEVFDAPLAKARAAGIASERLVLGDGRSLPFADASFDAVAFVNSFHHVPGEDQAAVLAEVDRVLRPGGSVFAFEPRPYGRSAEILRPIDDETEVRTRAQALLEAPPAPFRLTETLDYDLVRYVTSCDQLVQNSLAVDPERAAVAARPGVLEEVQARFAKFAEPTEGGEFRVVQPCVFYRLDR